MTETWALAALWLGLALAATLVWLRVATLGATGLRRSHRRRHCGLEALHLSRVSAPGGDFARAADRRGAMRAFSR